MKTPFFNFDLNLGYLPKSKILPPKDYSSPIDEVTKEKFPNCCPMHKDIYSRHLKWFEEFPHCCKPHKELIKYKWFEKSIYKDLPITLISRLSYTEYIISSNLESEEWYEAITEYVEYINVSFGFPSVGANEYLQDVEYIFNNTSNIPDNKRVKLSEYLKLYETSNIKVREKKSFDNDLTLLYDTYRKWLNIFPFEISFLSHLKTKLEHNLPLLAGTPRINRYSGYPVGKLHTKSSLIEHLLKITDEIISEINTYYLFNANLLSDPDKLQLELILSERRLELNEGYTNKIPNEEHEFIEVLSKWIKDEQSFLIKVKPFLFTKTDNPERTKADIISERLSNYCFHELEMVSKLDNKKQAQIVHLLATNKLPYCIAMLNYLGFIKLIETQYSSTSDKRNIIIAKIFDSDTSGRNVKGLINSLVKPTEGRYKAYNYKEQVQSDYQNIK